MVKKKLNSFLLFQYIYISNHLRRKKIVSFGGFCGIVLGIKNIEDKRTPSIIMLSDGNCNCRTYLQNKVSYSGCFHSWMSINLIYPCLVDFNIRVVSFMEARQQLNLLGFPVKLVYTETSNSS